jgi:hypothetical protein
MCTRSGMGDDNQLGLGVDIQSTPTKMSVWAGVGREGGGVQGVSWHGGKPCVTETMNKRVSTSPTHPAPSLPHLH